MFTILIILLYPWKALNNRLIKLTQDESLHVLLQCILALAVMIVVAKEFWPLRNVWEFLIMIFVMIIGIGIVICLISEVALVVIGILLSITGPFSRAYDKCVSRRQNPVAKRKQLDLQYFIEAEKGKPVCCLKYLGKG